MIFALSAIDERGRLHLAQKCLSLLPCSFDFFTGITWVPRFKSGDLSRLFPKEFPLLSLEDSMVVTSARCATCYSSGDVPEEHCFLFGCLGLAYL